MVLAVHSGDRKAQVGRYFLTEMLPFQALLQYKDELSQAFGVTTFPLNIVVGPDRKVCARIEGFPAADLREALHRSIPKK